MITKNVHLELDFRKLLFLRRWLGPLLISAFGAFV